MFLGSPTILQSASGRKKQIKASESRLRSVFRATPVGITFNFDRVIANVNDSMCNLMGYTEEEMVGKSARQFYETEEDFESAGRKLYFRKFRKLGRPVSRPASEEKTEQ